MRRFFLSFLIYVCFTTNSTAYQSTPQNLKSLEAAQKARTRLHQLLKRKQLSIGSPIYIRIFKHERLLEMWMKNSSGTFTLLKSYMICHNSGSLGPKEKEGDLQSPEGFYKVSANQLNPESKYHLSFNLGYPNEYDLYYDRTGSALMVHGRCSSVGCFAMTDYFMDEIYSLADAALAHGQESFDVHIFPFRYEENGLPSIAGTYPKWHTFWLDLWEGYRLFEIYRSVPEVTVSNGRYSCTMPSAER
ncbi:MAG: 2-dehydro-3-deoxyphosphooctonate aldolase [Desulfobulbaceae bacterium]|nr:MAG: 2-dehydro-3-deoxyphosphooctonate aldolase [Desulfobulbaceae bacterium]